VSEPIEVRIQQNIHAEQAKAHLRCVLHYFVKDREGYKYADQKISEFIEWLEGESPWS
jgi:hypothetical protein